MRVPITKALVSEVLNSVRNTAQAEVTYCDDALGTARGNLLTYLNRDILERMQWGALYDNFKADMYPTRWLPEHTSFYTTLRVSTPTDMPATDDAYTPEEYASALNACRAMNMPLRVDKYFGALGLNHIKTPPDVGRGYVPPEAMKATYAVLVDLRDRLRLAEAKYSYLLGNPVNPGTPDPRVDEALRHLEDMRVALSTAEAEAKAAYGDNFFDGMPYPDGLGPGQYAVGLGTDYFAPQAASLDVLQAYIRHARAKKNAERVAAGVEQILGQYPSLNKAVFAYPELRHYIPVEYIEKMNTPDKPRAPRQAATTQDDDTAAPALNPGDLTTILAKAELIRGS